MYWSVHAACLEQVEAEEMCWTTKCILNHQVPFLTRHRSHYTANVADQVDDHSNRGGIEGGKKPVKTKQLKNRRENLKMK